MTRDERRERTRADLIKAARRVFLEHGFHGASLEEISAAAGYSTGAVYSNFESKDDLFLAVLDERTEARVRAYAEAVLDADSYEEGILAAARLAWRGARDTPEWIPLLTEFWTHVSRRDGLRAAASERHERVMDAIAELITELSARHGVEYMIPTRDVARGSSALVRGMELERLVDPDGADPELFEEMWMAFVKGIAKERK